MKLSILASVSAAALLFAGSALADDNVSTVNQTGVSSSTGPVATVNQSGPDGSTSRINQNDSGASRVDVIQSGDGGYAGAPGTANDSTVNTDNASGGSTVYVNQNQNQGAYGQNKSTVQQGRNAFDADIAVRQTGGENSSNVNTFTGSGGEIVDVRQNGVRNNSDVTQRFQQGSQAYVDQTGYGGPNNVTIQQIDQGFAEAPPAFGVMQVATAYQNGENLSSNIYQTGSTNDASPPQNDALSYQTGNNQFSNIDQSGNDNNAQLYQTGSGHVSYIAQSGNTNVAYTEQNGTNNLSSVDQSGSNNRAETRQQSTSNESYITQSSNGNTALVAQNSADNLSSINQAAGLGYVSVTQN